ncbi:hypothetical protein D3C72_2297700 [compost metagenome]
MGIALDYQGANGAVVRGERHAQPIQGSAVDRLHMLGQCRQGFWRTQQGLPGADDFGAEGGCIALVRSRCLMALINVVGEAQLIVLLIVKGHREVDGR